MREKSGEWDPAMLFFAIFELMLLVMGMAFIIHRVSDATKDQTYYLRFIARDVALTVDALHVPEGDFKLFYAYSTPKLSALDISLAQKMAIVSPVNQRNETNPLRTIFLFGYENRTNVTGASNYTYEEPAVAGVAPSVFSMSFALKREGNNITIAEERPGDIELK